MNVHSILTSLQRILYMSILFYRQISHLEVGLIIWLQLCYIDKFLNQKYVQILGLWLDQTEVSSAKTLS